MSDSGDEDDILEGPEFPLPTESSEDSEVEISESSSDEGTQLTSIQNNLLKKL